MRSFSTLFALVPYSTCSMAVVAAGFGPTGFGHASSKTLPFLIDVLTFLLPLSFLLRYDVVSPRHSENRPPSFPSLQSNFTYSAFSALLVPEKSSLQTVFPLSNPFFLFFCVRRLLLLIFFIKPLHFPGNPTRSMGNSLIYVETTGFHWAGHAVYKMDADSKSPSSPVKIYLYETDKLGNYESILP